MVKVLGLGDNVCDIYLHTQVMYPGGQALNFAVYAQMLGAQSDFLGVNGTDAFAAHILQTLSAKGVGHSHCRCTEGENGFACVTLEDGDRVFKGSNRGGVLQKVPIVLTPDDLLYLDGFDVIHATNNGFLDGELQKLTALSPLLSYDFSTRWNEADRVERVCPHLDFGFLSCGSLSEEETQTLCQTLHGKGCGIVVATRGSRGALVWDGVHFYHQQPHLVQATDTMGAGDSFSTCMLVRIAEALQRDKKTALADAGWRAKVLPDILDSAAAFAAQTCLVSGAFGCGIAVPEEVKERIAEVAG